MVFRRVTELREDTQEAEISMSGSLRKRKRSASQPAIGRSGASKSKRIRPMGTQGEDSERAINHPDSIRKEMGLLRRVRLHTGQRNSSTEKVAVKLLRLRLDSNTWKEIASGHCYGLLGKVSTIPFLIYLTCLIVQVRLLIALPEQWSSCN